LYVLEIEGELRWTTVGDLPANLNSVSRLFELHVLGNIAETGPENTMKSFRKRGLLVNTATDLSSERWENAHRLLRTTVFKFDTVVVA